MAGPPLSGLPSRFCAVCRRHQGRDSPALSRPVNVIFFIHRAWTRCGRLLGLWRGGLAGLWLGQRFGRRATFVAGRVGTAETCPGEMSRRADFSPPGPAPYGNCARPVPLPVASAPQSKRSRFAHRRPALPLISDLVGALPLRRSQLALDRPVPHGLRPRVIDVLVG